MIHKRRGLFMLNSHVFIVGWRRSSGSWSNKRRNAIYARETYSVSIGPLHVLGYHILNLNIYMYIYITHHTIVKTCPTPLAAPSGSKLDHHSQTIGEILDGSWLTVNLVPRCHVCPENSDRLLHSRIVHFMVG